MNISAPFIKRPIGTSLLAAALLMAGALAFNFLPVAPLPQVEFPVISVGAGLPGASPETMASAVATPLERQFGRIAGVNQMTSISQTGIDRHHSAIRPQPQHRCRGARRAGRHQRGPQPASGQSARQSHLPESESGRRAHPDSGAHLRHHYVAANLRRRRLDPFAEAGANRRSRTGVRGRRRAAGGTRRIESHFAEQTGRRPGHGSHRPGQCQRQQTQGFDSTVRSTPGLWTTTIRSLPPTSTAD